MKKYIREYFQLWQDTTIVWERPNEVVPSAVLIGLVIAPIAIAWTVLLIPFSFIASWLSKKE